MISKANKVRKRWFFPSIFKPVSRKEEVVSHYVYKGKSLFEQLHFTESQNHRITE